MKVNKYAWANNNPNVSGHICLREELSIWVQLWHCLSGTYCCPQISAGTVCFIHSPPPRIFLYHPALPSGSTDALKICNDYAESTAVLLHIHGDVLQHWIRCLNRLPQHGDWSSQQLEIASAFNRFFWYKYVSPCCYPFLVQKEALNCNNEGPVGQ